MDTAMNVDHNQSLELRKALKANAHRLYSLFQTWDEDETGYLNKSEFGQMCRMMNIRVDNGRLEMLMDMCDSDKNGRIDLNEMIKMVEETPDDVPDEDNAPKRNILVRGFKFAYWLINTTLMQAFLYFAFVVVFQTLTISLRATEEYYLDKMFSDTFIENAFDSALNEFKDIRRTADVYEWGNTVLWPGLLGNMGPACGDIGKPGVFNTAMDAPPIELPLNITCSSNSWPDGEGSYAMNDATPWTVDELVDRFNMMDWSEGIAIYQSRVQAVTAAKVCQTATIGQLCYPEMNAELNSDYEDTAPFGYNWSHPRMPLSHPFKYTSAADSGHLSAASANPASLRVYPAGGFLALVIPFFSDTYLPPQRGLPHEVIDFTLYRASSSTDRVPRFFCVRLLWNGAWMHQLCDPGEPDGSNRTTGVVRHAIEEMWNDLRRAHWIDKATRAMTITIPFASNNVGVRSRVTLMFEFTSAGSILPSYDVMTRVTKTDAVDSTFSYNLIALFFTAFFCSLELVEMASGGISQYFTDMWNVMDWLNYTIFFIAFLTIIKYQNELENVPCHKLCQETGYQDSWQVMATTRDAKFFLSICVCIQLLKIIKFTSALIPKMDLAPSVLKKALPDLVFFGIVFLISMLAFSTMFFIQLGPFLVDYSSQEAALIGLGRALFGDFDIDEIMDNSAGYMNAVLFLVYLFVSVFIMLSMFFAILGENQANLRDEQREARESGDAVSEYGVITMARNGFTNNVLIHVPRVGDNIRKARKAAREKMIEQAKSNGATSVDRIEARQRSLSTKVTEISETLSTFDNSLRGIAAQLEVLKRSAAQPLRQMNKKSSREAKSRPDRSSSAREPQHDREGRSRAKDSSSNGSRHESELREKGSKLVKGRSPPRPLGRGANAKSLLGRDKHGERNGQGRYTCGHGGSGGRKVLHANPYDSGSEGFLDA